MSDGRHSNYRSGYAPLNQRSPSPPPSSSPASWTRGSFIRRARRHGEILDPRPVKSTAPSISQYQDHYSNQSDGYSYTHSYPGSRIRPSAEGAFASPPYNAPPRSIKALKAPNRSSAPLSPHQQHQHDYHPSPSPQPMHPSSTRFEDGPLQRYPALTLHGMKCNEITQKAYSGQSLRMKESFDNLQRMDIGKVDDRSIAFCTGLTSSRWEPAVPPTTAVTSSEEVARAGPPSSRPPHNSAHASRLLNLFSYIRHIVSLTSGVSNTHLQANPNPNPNPNANANANANTKQQNKQDQMRAPDNSPHGVPQGSGPSGGPGPIKSESNWRHRYSPDYHQQLVRRNEHRQMQSDRDDRRLSTDYPLQDNPSFSKRSGYQDEYGYREGSRGYDQHPQGEVRQEEYQGTYRTTSRPYPQPQLHHAPHPRQPSASLAWPSHSAATPTKNLPPFLKVPYPNLTLTLAQIYVDRLKAKYPDVEGEPGCSFRLFLIAYIIAAKYRCSVELTPSPQQDADRAIQEKYDQTFSHSDRSMDYIDGYGEYATDGPISSKYAYSAEQNLEARLNAELIFSNHAWVRLLNHGLFYRQPTASSPAIGGATPPPHDPTSTTIAGQPPFLSSIIKSGSSPGTTSLDVADLDRMEAEFLTFLEFDLATESHDLKKCWDLVMGTKDSR
ncbi:MAG: hypothetical protein J3Q66DRAFT_345836 [Benniella sp.]|nr:MAG: hypothetical protein J3Q66DRAFT_345836 [Benniella sp.]